MRNYLFVGLGIIILGVAGWLFYFHTASVPPAPKDLTKVLPTILLEKASPEQLVVLRGEAATAPLVSAVANNNVRSSAPSTPPTAVENALKLPAGLTATLTTDTKGTLKGEAANATNAALTYTFPAGTLFSNGTGDVVLLNNYSVSVPPQATAPLSLPVAQISADKGVLQGSFTPHAGTVDPLQPLLKLLASKKRFAPSVTQTAVLIVNSDASLDVLTNFPRLLPVAASVPDPRPFAVSPADLIAALSLIQEAGIDPATTGVLGQPQFKIMTMLDPDSRPAAKAFFGISDETEWAFWKQQLTQGDPSLRHFALCGIARYYPDTALVMLPRWVRDATLYRDYRLTAAWALALIDDARAQGELQNLRGEFQSDAGLRQTIDRALKRWENGSAKVASNTIN